MFNVTTFLSLNTISSVDTLSQIAPLSILTVAYLLLDVTSTVADSFVSNTLI